LSRAEAFRRDGFVQGIDVLEPREARRLREAFQRVERRLGPEVMGSPDPAKASWKSSGHPLQKIFQFLATHPAVIEAMSELLGSDLLVRNGDVFIKPVGSRRGIDWHVDTPHPWPDSRGLATVWIGLTEASEENGGVQYLPGSHLKIFEREPADRESLTLDPEQCAELRLSSAEQVRMRPGQMAVHSFRTVHRSQRNLSSDRRIGMVLRFLSADTSPEIAECGQAFLVHGSAGAWEGRLRPEFPISWSSG
jgi:non-heme Fe2+,alpha-ketoglutarate-dependent halogenase